MKNKINLSLLLAALFLTVAFISCKKDSTKVDDNNTKPPAQPMQITGISPAEGGAGTYLLINGTSFTTDSSKIQVSINGVPLRIVCATRENVVVQVMGQTGLGPIMVKIGNDSVTSSTNFQYDITYTVSTFAGSGAPAFTDAQGINAAFNFGAQAQMGIDANGNLYVPDRNNNKFRKITPDGVVTTFAGLTSFIKPCAAGVAPDGNIWLADRGTMSVYKCSPDGSTVTKIMGTDTCGGTGLATEIYSFAFDNAGGVYWSDLKQNRIICLKNGVWKSVISCTAPGSMVMDANKNIYVSLSANHIIKKYTYNAANDTWDAGVIIAGQDGQSGWADGVGAQAKFATPWALAFDKWGNLLCCGQGMTASSNCVRKISLTAPYQVTTIAGTATSASYYDGTGLGSSFNGPVGMVVSKEGIIYVLDRENNRIRKIEEK